MSIGRPPKVPDNYLSYANQLVNLTRVIGMDSRISTEDRIELELHLTHVAQKFLSLELNHGKKESA